MSKFVVCEGAWRHRWEEAMKSKGANLRRSEPRRWSKVEQKARAADRCWSCLDSAKVMRKVIWSLDSYSSVKSEIISRSRNRRGSRESGLLMSLQSVNLSIFGKG